MNLQLSDDQEMMRESFARFLDEHSSMERVRAAQSTGFDPALWRGLAEFGAFLLRVPEAAGGLNLGMLDALALMEEAGRTLASGPLAEALVASRLLGQFAAEHEAFTGLVSGDTVVSIALHDVGERPMQWVAGGSAAHWIIGLNGDRLILFANPHAGGAAEANLASVAIAECDFGALAATVLAKGEDARTAFLAGVEEWKLLLSAALSGLARESVRLASLYAVDRVQFGQPIGAYQAISHPLANLITEIDGGKYLNWKVLRDIADGVEGSNAAISLATWWNIDVAGRAVAQALHSFGGYGLTTEYDIHLYNLRAKAWPLILGDPARLLEEAGARRYAGVQSVLPDVGEVGIDFDVGAEAHALARDLNDFFNSHLTPELRAKGHYSFDGHDAGIHKKLAEHGLLFPSWPTELGGRNASPYAINAASHVWEEQNWTSHAANVTKMVGTIIHRFGSDELKRDVLSKIISGEVVCSLGYSEPGSGSDVFAAKCRATRQGDGWRIEGQKMFTSGANIADYVLLLTRTDPDAVKHKGLTMFIVPLKAGGVEIQPVYTFQDERTNITYYDGVQIPDSYRLGDVGGGVRVMSASLELEHGGGFGRTQKAMVTAAEDLCGTIAVDGAPLIRTTSAQVRLARAAVHFMISEVLSYRAVWAGMAGCGNVGFGPMVKLFSSEKFLTDAADLLDLTAPVSLSKREGPAQFLNQCYRHAQATTIYGGTSEIHRSLIAERLLGLPRSRA